MREWLQELWTNKSAFRAFVRFIIAMAGVVVTQIPGVPVWVGLAIVAVSNAIAAGEQNPTGTHEPRS